jgi:CheY-like chemotaxis protein
MFAAVLRLARVEAASNWKFERVDASAILRELCEFYEPAAEEQGRKLTATIQDGLMLKGDHGLFTQAVSNLIENALKYTPAGGWVEVTVERSDGQGVLRVRDSGVGIAEDRLSSIFGLFAQAENSIGRTQGGMGIGLSLVKSLVELHSGKVYATSDGVGKGSEFVVYLPLAQDRKDQRPVRAQRKPFTARRTYSVVIIEDNSDVRTLLQVRLQKLGHKVDAAADGEEGVKRITRVRPDIAIVDIGLPGMDGYSVARRVRESLGDEVFLLALSGFGQPEDKRKAIDSGFDEHITKPIDGRALEDLLARIGNGRPRGAESTAPRRLRAERRP